MALLLFHFVAIYGKKYAVLLQSGNRSLASFANAMFNPFSPFTSGVKPKVIKKFSNFLFCGPIPKCDHLLESR